MSCEQNGQIDISVIIPLYKGQKYCKRLLDMIEKNSLYRDLYKTCKIEVLFVNDFPDDKIVIDNQTYHFVIKLIEQEENIGIHGARVKGIRKSTGEFVIMLDQDDFVTEDWLYELRNRIISENAEYCVCNGCSSRFRILRNENAFLTNINNLEYYLTAGNLITSPGQVLIRKSAIPEDWLSNIQKCNGADDYLLWIMALKKGFRFVAQKKCLYYHTPERSADSIGTEKMFQSVEEMREILIKTGYLDKQELEMLNHRIEKSKEGNAALSLSASAENLEKYMSPKSGIKFRNMFFMMHKWMKLKNSGIEISDYLKNKGITKVAIYGMGYIGECLYQELLNANVQVVFAIDRTAVDFKRELPIIKLEDEFEDTDLIISTVVEDVSETLEFLREKGKCQVVTFSQMLTELNYLRE